MHTIIIQKTLATPEVVLDSTNGIFRISGKSVPNEADVFYRPVTDWLDKYLRFPNEITIIVFELEYFNSISSKVFMHIFKKLDISFNNGKKISIDWRYAEDDMDTLEAGMDFASLVKVPFSFSVVQYY